MPRLARGISGGRCRRWPSYGGIRRAVIAAAVCTRLPALRSGVWPTPPSRPGRRPTGGLCSTQPSKPSPITRHQLFWQRFTLPSTPLCSLAMTAAAASGLARSSTSSVLPFGCDTSAVRRPGQQRVIHPALGAFPVADAAPVLEFGRDLDRQGGAAVDPGDVVVLGRTGAHIDLVGLEADEARHRQSARGSGLLGGARRRARKRDKHQDDHDPQPALIIAPARPTPPNKPDESADWALPHRCFVLARPSDTEGPKSVSEALRVSAHAVNAA